jgi:O-antigen/teichoic acid export membrane protein
VAAKAVALVSVPFLTRQLGPHDYGLVDLAASLAGLLVILVRFSGDIPTMRLAASEDPGARGRTYFAFVAMTGLLSTAVAVVLVPFAGLIATTLWSSPDGSLVALAALALVPVNATQTALANVLRFSGRPSAFARVATVDLLAQVSFAVAFAALGMGASGVVFGYIIGGTIGWVATASAARGHLTTEFHWARGRTLMREGLPFLPSVIAFFFADTISRMLTANTLGLSAVGNLAFAIRVASLMTLVSSAFSAAWGPYALGLQPSPETRAMLSRVLHLAAALVCASAVAVGAVAPELATVVAGSDYRASAVVVPGLLLATGFTVVLYILTTAAGISFRGSWVTLALSFGATLQVAVVALLVPEWGIVGVAVGALLGRLTALALLSRGVTDTVHVSAPTALMILIATGTTFVVQRLNADPPETIAFRLAIAAVAGAWAIWMISTTGRAVLNTAGAGRGSR